MCGGACACAFLTRTVNQEREGQINEALVVGVRDEYQRLFASAEVKELIAMYDGAEDGAQRLKACDFVLGVLSNGSLKGNDNRSARLSLLRYCAEPSLTAHVRVWCTSSAGSGPWAHIREFCFHCHRGRQTRPHQVLAGACSMQGGCFALFAWRTHSSSFGSRHSNRSTWSRMRLLTLVMPCRMWVRTRTTVVFVGTYGHSFL
jgi:hypothetical protein